MLGMMHTKLNDAPAVSSLTSPKVGNDGRLLSPYPCAYSYCPYPDAHYNPDLHPGFHVLVNKLHITDAVEFDMAQEVLVKKRAEELFANPLLGRFNLYYLMHIHRYLFQDVFEWAGVFRIVNIRNVEHHNTFVSANLIQSHVVDLFDRLEQENALCGLSERDFIEKAAMFFAKMNAIHPFREGNGRTLRELLRVIALRAGREIDWSRISKPLLNTLSKRSFNELSIKPCVQIIERVLVAEEERHVLKEYKTMNDIIIPRRDSPLVFRVASPV